MLTNYTPKSWYKKWWGVMIIVISIMILALIIATSAITFRYWQMIRSGHGDYLHEKFYGQSELTAEESARIKKIRLNVEASDDPSLGAPNGEIVIVEFIDFKCPVCREQNPDIKRVAAEFGERVKLIVRDFPVELTHPGTMALAKYASCAYNQGVYWPIHDYFFDHQDELGETLSAVDITNLNNNFGLNAESMNECLVEGGEGQIEVNQDYATGLQNGLRRGTPTFFVNGYVVEGYVSYEKWRELIEGLN